MSALFKKQKNDFALPEQFGAIGDGINVDTSQVENAISSANKVTGGKNSFYKIGPVNLNSGNLLEGVKFLANSGNAETLKTAGAAVNLKLIGVDIDANSTGIALHQNSAGCADVIISASRILGRGYGYLANVNDTGYGVVINGSAIHADTGDSIELNTTSGNSKGYVLTSNILTGGPNGSGSTSGFAVGIAKTKGHITANNYIKSARNEAIHVEDDQSLGVVTGNVAAACLNEAFRLLPRSNAGPVIYTNNYSQHVGVKTGVLGVRLVNDANGHVRFNVLSNNIVRGFGSGYRQEGSGVQAVGVNVAIECDKALQISSNGIWLGTTFANNCTEIASGANGTIIGKVVSDVNIQNPLTKSGTNFPGTVCKGWLMPVKVEHQGGGSVNFNIASLPSRAAGKIIILSGGGTNGIFYSADIHWDGTTLTLTNVINRHAGAVAGSNLVVDSGSLAFRFNSASAITLITRVDFEGVWYVHE